MAAQGESANAAVVSVERAGAASDLIIVCEHASHRLPPERAGMGLGPDAQVAHIAWDPGALGVARALSRRLDATLVAAEVSRLVYDLNRPPHADGAMPERSELFDIPGNFGVSPAERLARTRAIYLPFHDRLRGLIAERLALGRIPQMATIHSFTPVYFGKPRAVEIGFIHDADPALAVSCLASARALFGFRVELNAPYDAADGVTHTLRLQATPYGLANVMIEIRNDLITTQEDQEAMADKLALILTRAHAALADSARKAAL